MTVAELIIQLHILPDDYSDLEVVMKVNRKGVAIWVDRDEILCSFEGVTVDTDCDKIVLEGVAL